MTLMLVEYGPTGLLLPRTVRLVTATLPAFACTYVFRLLAIARTEFDSAIKDPPRSQYALVLAITCTLATALLVLDSAWFAYFVSDVSLLAHCLPGLPCFGGILRSREKEQPTPEGAERTCLFRAFGPTRPDCPPFPLAPELYTSALRVCACAWIAVGVLIPVLFFCALALQCLALSPSCYRGLLYCRSPPAVMLGFAYGRSTPISNCLCGWLVGCYLKGGRMTVTGAAFFPICP